MREALIAWGRRDLIGTGPDCLVPPGPAKAADPPWKRGGEPTVGAMGMAVERATREELNEERWEGHARAEG